MSNKIKKIKYSVSIVTISKFSRYNCLINLYELIKLQTYDNIIEWIIVEGSNNNKDAEQNKILIDELKKNIIYQIVYIEYTGKKLSDLRNLGNSRCSGDIIVIMDDDDYYFPDRVSHAVNMLSKSSYLIAGCSAIYLFDYILHKLYKFIGFHNFHSTNNCMAYKKEYLYNHKHDSNLEMAEEQSFTNNFTEPMIQLDPIKTIIVSSHTNNTFNKREICIGGSYGINPTLKEISDHPIEYYIPSNIFNKMKSLFYYNENSIYDIVYYTGGFNNSWDPLDKSLGGSEQAIVYLSENWAKQGLKVAVYSSILSNNKNTIINNLVEYKDWKKFPFNNNFNIIILWRLNGLFSAISFDLKAKYIYWDLHDNFIDNPELIKVIPYYKKYSNKITKILFKSNYHFNSFEKFFKIKLLSSQYVIIPNGIVVNKFSNNWDKVERNPYRFCYVSYYTRGLPTIIPNIWTYIKQLEPKCELHLYYGMDMFTDEIKQQLKLLISRPGVIDHGRQNIDIIVREKYLSSFQLYVTETQSEIDCISIKESLLTGCIPILSNFGVFKEREGIHLDINKDTALNIIKLMNNFNQLNILRNVFMKSKTIMDWSEIANLIINIDKYK